MLICFLRGFTIVVNLKNTRKVIDMMGEYLKDYPAVLTVKQVAEILGVCKASVLNLIHENKLQAIKVGRLYKIPKDQIINYLKP